ncbi:prepilin-type N-terminal cleavage/methylation domain-containing protein [Pseudomonas cavernicola]|uniref:Type II secretion system protein H n=1 Tax=Pseudomonas cavernicola TaxID=2320866 RepID=A0A418XPB4_9PSED|nr:GspH/FimT family pseudopilin [Pseudomonas cavernicola]RJG14298.1 prepilin-type N-terminal cleavage/methylation domain-containing protein [Pseudomonas cavernicola]
MKFARQLSSLPASRSARQRGFTLIELMVTIAVMAVLLGIAIPSFTDVTLGSKLRSQANDLVAGATLARSEAIKRNQAVTLCASSNGTSCTGGWAAGWIVISSDGTVILKHPAAAGGFHINSADTSFSFQSTGVGVTPTPAVPTFTVCRATPSVGSQERVVTISLTGRTSVAKTTNASCS